MLDQLPTSHHPELNDLKGISESAVLGLLLRRAMLPPLSSIAQHQDLLILPPKQKSTLHLSRSSMIFPGKANCYFLYSVYFFISVFLTSRWLSVFHRLDSDLLAMSYSLLSLPPFTHEEIEHNC